MNALNEDLLLSLQEQMDVVASDDTIRVLVLTGNGKAFCAGADLKGILDIVENPDNSAPDILSLIEDTFNCLNNFPKPVIAALNGITLAGGLELAMTADIVLAAQSCKIGDAHANFGVFPGAGGAVRLPRLIGGNFAKFLLYTGAIVPAQEFLASGFIKELVPDHQLQDRVQELAQIMATKSPIGLQRMKTSIAIGIEKPLDEALTFELSVLRDHLQCNDAREGLEAFTQKRKPVFTGS
tara:strand:- start:6468 stop:7184 length:717 start_codon:yes stop_codon:yes gene_type:complete